jgi:thiamine biosynthesis lipoprotein
MQQQKQISRRSFLKIIAVGTLSAGAGLAFGLDRWSLTQPVTATRLLMGTVVNLTIVGDNPAAAQTAIEATLNRMADLEAQLSRHRPDSQLSRLNRDGQMSRAGQPLLEVLAQARQLSILSDGAFDVTIKPLVDLYQHYHTTVHTLPPDDEIERTLARVNYRQVRIEGQRVWFGQPGMSITLDGLAKGYIVDAGVAVLKQAGFANVLVEAGGDLVAAGQKSPQEPWQIGVKPPRPAQSGLLNSFDVRDRAVATSGDYMQAFSPDLRQHHILDPRTGYSAPELASATVIAPSAMLADGLATAAMVMGSQATREMINHLPGCDPYLVTK